MEHNSFKIHFFIYLIFFFFFFLHSVAGNSAEFSQVHVHTCVHACRVPNFIIFLLLSSYFDFLHSDFHCFTFECELPGGAFFYVLNYSEFPSAFTWLVVVKIMLGPWDLTLCREDVEFCQPVKYVWLFFPFFFFSASFICFSSCVVPLYRLYLTEILYLLCAALF